MTDRQTATGFYFLSYSRSDQQVALRFANDLRSAGIAMWVDQLDIRPSEHWDRAIERAVRECRGIVVMLSPRSAASDNVADEISFAIDHGKSVLPVMIERCRLPLRIARMQVIDATGDYRRAVQQCLDALGGTSPQASEVSSGITDNKLIDAAKAQLTPMLGPIAAILVDQTASQARSADEFHGLLAQRIESPTDRDCFMKAVAAPRPAESSPMKTDQKKPPVGSAELDHLSSLLTPYIGPMAALIARRESAGATSSEDLHQRLASRIPDGVERADFLRRVQKS